MLKEMVFAGANKFGDEKERGHSMKNSKSNL